MIPIIYMLARNRQLNHGPVPSEREWYAEQARLAREADRAYRNAHGGGHYRRRY